MTILLVQTFLLLLLAFLLGAALACLIRRGLHGSAAETRPASRGAAAAVAAGGAALDTGRFERALVGGEGRAVPPVFHGQPVVEVQPRAVAPAAEPAPVDSPPAPARNPAPPAPEVAEVPFTPVSAPRPSAPVAVVAAPMSEPSPPPPAAEPAPRPPAETERPTVIARTSAEPSYAEMAVAAAAAAAAAQSQRPEPAVLASERQASYTEIAVAAAAAAAAEAEARRAAEDAEASESSRFGTPVEDATVPADATLPADGGDDLTRIHGIDADLRARLNRLGVHRFEDIAAWRASDVARLSQSLGFAGRIEQENWVGQAQILTRGGDAQDARIRETVTAEAPVAPLDGERLHRIIGIDPQSEALLFANGVKTLADIAGWTDADIKRFEGLIGSPGRIGRENWVEQARFLTRGASPDPEPEPGPASNDEPAASSEPRSAPSPEPVPAASEDHGAASPDVDAAGASAARADYSALRSVKSEALLGDAAPYVAPSGEVDDLKRIRGIGVLIEKRLNALGVTGYEQIANWTGADIDRISEMLDFKGRIQRENWVEQARILASGGQTEFSRRADRGEV